MGWFSDLVGGVGLDSVETYLNKNAALEGLISGGIASAASSAFLPDYDQKTGYQGEVPKYTAVRERVPMQAPVEGQAPRRPGSAGRRYFTDTQFAKRPDTEVPTIEEARATAQAEAQQLAKSNQQVQGMAAGGIASAHKGYYLGGKTDGMADKVPATIDGTQEARLSDGEFVIPADVVSHLGNGNSDAGAEQLHGMMDGVRKARTGNPEQGKQIDPNKFMPKMAQGGGIAAYNNGGSIKKFQAGGYTTTNPTGNTTNSTTGVAANNPTGSITGKEVGQESSLSSWAGDYVTDMLGRGQALGQQGYQAYEGPLSAGASGLQQQAFTTAGQLEADPASMGVASFGADQAQQYMNPYLMASLNPQLDEARRQAEIDRVAAAGRLTRAGGFGGSRQALMESEGLRNLQTNLADITGKGYATAYDRALDQYNKEQAARNKYGFDVMAQQQGLGAIQRGIESEGQAADYAQFKEERDFPYKQVQYMQSLLQGLPIEAQSVSYAEPSKASQIMGTMEGIQKIYDELRGLSGSGSSGTGGTV